MTLHNLGYVVLRQGDTPQAAAFFEQSLALYQALKRKHGITECLIGLAAVAVVTGQPTSARRAARLFGAAEGLFEAAVGWPPPTRPNMITTWPSRATNWTRQLLQRPGPMATR